VRLLDASSVVSHVSFWLPLSTSWSAGFRSLRHSTTVLDPCLYIQRLVVEGMRRVRWLLWCEDVMHLTDGEEEIVWI